jgi:FAD/FMN-containing dehydrogenase
MQWLPGHGAIFVGGEWSLEQAREVDDRLRGPLAEASGLRQWMTRPEHSPTLAPFAPLPTDLTLLQRIKAMMDPRRLLNPGRLA